MIVVCPGCKNQITIDDAIVPKGTFKLRCTSCGRTINAQMKEEPADTSRPAGELASKQKSGTASTPTGEKSRTSSGISRESAILSQPVQEYVANQIAAAKKEILDAMQTLLSGAGISRDGSYEDSSFTRRALICSGDSAIGTTLLSFAQEGGYDTESCSTAAESLKSVDSQYGLVVIDPSFADDLEGAKKIIGKINVKKGTHRRRTFVVLLSSTYKTMDGNSAFLNGVNLIVNKADIDQFDSILQQAKSQFQQMYAPLRSIADRK